MQYLGGKGRQAGHLAQIINSYAKHATRYYEPFLGGGSVFERVAHLVPRPRVSDIQLDLIMMWQAVVGGWWVPPESVTREDYQSLRHADSSAMRGFVGFGCSFGGKWFGGYASNARGDDFCGQSRRSVLRKAEAMRVSGASILHHGYENIDPEPGSLVYCDPPYSGTTAYGAVGNFDSSVFWSRAHEWASRRCTVLVSEYSAPDGVRCIWENGAKVSLRKDSNTKVATERLFILRG